MSDYHVSTPVSPTDSATERNYYLLGLAVLALLLCGPSYVRWFGPAELISQNEFDPWLGLTRDRRIPQLVHTLLWLLYALLYHKLGKGQRKIPLTLCALIWTIFLLAPPWISPDVFFYLAKGHMASVYGENAHIVPITALSNASTDPMFDSVVPSIRGIVGNYGPLFQQLSLFIARISNGNPLVGLALFKAVVALCTLGCTIVVQEISNRRGNSPDKNTGALLALHPIVVFSFLTAAHNDPIVMLLILSGILALLRNRDTLGGLLMGLSITIKPIAVFIVPAVLLYRFASDNARPLRQRILPFCFGIGAGAILPFVVVPSSFTFLANIATTQNQGVRATVHLATAVLGLQLDHSLLLTRILFAVILLARLRSNLRLHRHEPEHLLLVSAFELLVLAQILTMQSMTEWYSFWPLCFAACVSVEGSRRWSDAVAFYYMPLAAWHVVGPWATVYLTQVSIVGFQLAAALRYFRDTKQLRNSLPVVVA